MDTKPIKFEFASSNGVNTIRGFKFIPKGEVKLCVMIVHGMIEHCERYFDFMQFLESNGIAAYAHDHLGHKNSVDDDSQLGYFAKEAGYKKILEDMHSVSKLIKKDYPDKKLFLLGHSMGSFYSRVYASLYPDTIDALLLSGTGGSNPLAKVGEVVVTLTSVIKGGKAYSKTIEKMLSGSFMEKIENPKTSADWLSRDEELVLKTSKDKYCNFKFTLSAYKDLITINSLANANKTYIDTDKSLPIYLFSGEMDSVGNYGEGVKEVYTNYKNTNKEDVTLKLYKDARHETLNEINRQEVYNDVLNWINSKV